LPWSFGFPGLCDEALAESDGQWVPRQLKALLGGAFTDEAIAREFDRIQEELYGDKAESPYLSTADEEHPVNVSWRHVGVTTATIKQFAMLSNLSLHVLWGSRKILAYSPVEAEACLAMHIHGDHAFFVEDSQTRASIAAMDESCPAVPPDVVLTVVGKLGKTPPFQDWKPFSQGVGPGHYWAHDLAEVRLAYHEQRVCPRVELDGKGRPKGLHIRKGGGSIVVHQLKAEAHVCDAFVKLFNECYGAHMEYHESLAAVGSRVFEAILKGKRRPLTREERECFPTECQQCGASNLPLEIDHIVPLCSGGENCEENLQVLCTVCHAGKTRLDILTSHEHCLLSRFSLETHAAFVPPQKPPQLVCDFNHQQAEALSVDQKRSLQRLRRAGRLSSANLCADGRGPSQNHGGYC
jgi:5-methylcytosine-specific restriction endonuclease McrA